MCSGRVSDAALFSLLCDPISSYWASILRRCVVVDVTRENVWPTLPCRPASIICDGPLTAGGFGVMGIDVVPPGCTSKELGWAFAHPQS